MKINQTIKSSLYALIAGTMLNACSDKPNNPVGPTPGEKPTLQSIVINGDAEYTNSRNVKIAVNQKYGEQITLLGDITSPTGYGTIADTITAILTAGNGNKRVKAVIKNSEGISDTISDDITLDATTPSFTIPANLSLNDNTYKFNLDLSGINGTYTLTGATTGEGNITNLDSLLLNEGKTTIELYLRDSAGNDTTYKTQITTSKIRNEKEGLDSTLSVLRSLGYTVSDSAQELQIPTIEGNMSYLKTDASVRKNPGEEVFVIYDAAGAMGTTGKDAITYFNQTMIQAGIPRRIVFMEPSFNKEIAAKVKEEITAFEASLNQ